MTEAGDQVDVPVDVTVVMPAFNESEILERSVAAVVAGLNATSFTYEIVIVENGSTDDTLAIAQRLHDTSAAVRVESLTNPDYGAALRHGLEVARGRAVVNFDADYYDLAFLEAAVGMVLRPDGPAVVVGSKRAPGSDDRRALPRRLVTATFSTILKRGFGLSVSDTHGMKAMRRAAVLPFATSCRLGRDLFDTELILRVERGGLETAEIPVPVNELRPARTSILRRVPRTLLGLARLRSALKPTDPANERKVA